MIKHYIKLIHTISSPSELKYKQKYLILHRLRNLLKFI